MALKIPLVNAIVICLCVPLFSLAQGGGTLPVATTVELRGAVAEEGQVVVYLEATDTYELAQDPNDVRFFGVTAVRPALVFSTASGTVPVVTLGMAAMQVNAQNGNIERGDVLVTSWQAGSAMKAGNDLENVFAIALEPFEGTGNEVGVIAVEVNPQKAQDLQAAYVAEAAAATEAAADTAPEAPFSFVRAAIASVIAVGALFFILYSFRSIIAKGVVSVGRNPRASTSIVTFAFGNLLFALVLCAVAIFVAIAVLVLPI